MAMHAGELTISSAVVRDLIGAQFPQWRALPVRRVASSGTVNAIFRIGGRLAARFSQQGADPAVIRRGLESEAAAARELSAATHCRRRLSQAGGPASIRRRTSASPAGPRSMLHQLSTHQVAPAAAQDAGSGGSSWTNSPVLSASSTTS